MLNLPAGLIDDKAEFFTDSATQGVFVLLGGNVIAFEKFSEQLKVAVWHSFSTNPIKVRALIRLAGPCRDKMIKQYLLCLYSEFDREPDMINGKLMQPEYWACPNRGNCKHEGQICDRLKTPTGQYLTAREIQVLRLVAAGDLDKEIASKLGLSMNTIPMYTKSLRQKTGLQRKADLTRFAIFKNLI